MIRNGPAPVFRRLSNRSARVRQRSRCPTLTGNDGRRRGQRSLQIARSDGVFPGRRLIATTCRSDLSSRKRGFEPRSGLPPSSSGRESGAHVDCQFLDGRDRQETEDAFGVLTNGLWVGDHSVRDHDPRGRGEDNSREALKPDLNHSVTWVWWS